MDKFIQYISQNWKAVLITLLVCIVIYYIADWTGIIDKIKKGLKKDPKATSTGGDALTFDENGNLIAYNPRTDVVALKTAMDGFGTDEEAIFSILEGKSNPQLAAIYNDFNDYTGEDLFDWFNSELSGSELQRALEYFDELEIN